MISSRKAILFLDCAWEESWLVWYCADSRKVMMQLMVSSGDMSEWKKAAIGTLVCSMHTVME